MANQNQKTAEQANLGEALSRTELFFTNNKTGIIIGIVVVILIIVGIFGIKKGIVDPRNEKAAEALFPGEALFEQGDFLTALNGDEAGYMGFIEVAKLYKNTKSGNLANAYAGLCLAQLDSCDAAIEYLNKFKANDHIIAPAVLGALANCYANTDQTEKAASTFIAAAKQADDNLMTPYYYVQAGLIYENTGNSEKAFQLYKKVSDDYSTSESAYIAEKYMTRISAAK